jgi:hypothetical protein
MADARGTFPPTSSFDIVANILRETFEPTDYQITTILKPS